MARKKSPEPTSTEDATANLVGVLGCLTREVESLTQQVGALTEQANVLTAAIDDVRQEIEWAARNIARTAWTASAPNTSIPRDQAEPAAGQRPVEQTATQVPGQLF